MKPFDEVKFTRIARIENAVIKWFCRTVLFLGFLAALSIACGFIDSIGR